MNRMNESKEYNITLKGYQIESIIEALFITENGGFARIMIDKYIDAVNKSKDVE